VVFPSFGKGSYVHQQEFAFAFWNSQVRECKSYHGVNTEHLGLLPHVPLCKQVSNQEALSFSQHTNTSKEILKNHFKNVEKK